MKCPECGATDAENPHVLKNMGGKQRHPETNTRRYECQSCGHRFLSAEQYHRPVHPRDAAKKPNNASSPDADR